MAEQITRLEFTTPLRIISEANNYDHWAKKKKRKDAQRLEISAVMQNALRRRTIRLPCQVKLVRIGPKKLDRGNLEVGFKFVQNIIAEKLGVDDGDDKSVSWIYEQEPKGKREYGVRVEITSVGVIPAEDIVSWNFECLR